MALQGGKMATCSFAWLSVVVKRGFTTVLPRKVVKIGWENNFGELLTAANPEFEKEVVEKVTISTNERFVDPVHEVDLSAPVSVCDTFKCRFVCIFLKDQISAAHSVNTGMLCACVCIVCCVRTCVYVCVCVCVCVILR